MAASETQKYQNKSQCGVYEVYCPGKDNICERSTKLFNLKERRKEERSLGIHFVHKFSYVFLSNV